MSLHEINRGIAKYKLRKRIGRGIGSGHGKTSGRGHKGQRSNPGYSVLAIFEGGRMPLVRRIPKRGFTNKFALTVLTVNVGDLEQVFEAGAEVTPETLREKSLAKKRYDVLKILGNGELTRKLKVSAHRFSKSAREKIEKAGGEVIELSSKTSVEEKKKQKHAASSQASP
jgi:large subunit ribosomal protein L15